MLTELFFLPASKWPDSPSKLSLILFWALNSGDKWRFNCFDKNDSWHFHTGVSIYYLVNIRWRSTVELLTNCSFSEQQKMECNFHGNLTYILRSLFQSLLGPNLTVFKTTHHFVPFFKNYRAAQFCGKMLLCGFSSQQSLLKNLEHLT